MPDVTADIKTRYSIFVPKPLSRINFGDWQKRDGANFSPKFGYPGVSVQTEQSLFVDVVKTTYMQMRGSFVAHASDWLQCSLKPMVLATSDNATLGVDGTATLVAGAGQAPTWTLDHGDGIETVPYINLQLHYRVEEVQNSLFEFFRGRREKYDPFRLKDFGHAKLAIIPELFKKEIEFDSRTKLPAWMKLVGARDPKGAKEAAWTANKNRAVGDAMGEWKSVDKELRGGFELLSERSWQELFGKQDWSYADTIQEADPNYKDNPNPLYANKKRSVFKKFAPHDIFGGIKDVRSDPDAENKLDADITGDEGKQTERLLKYGFSAYFSRFDPYLLYDPEAIENDPKYQDHPLLKKCLVFLAKASNVATYLKRIVDVMYKMGTVLRDNALIKVVKDSFAAVDGLQQAVKAIRGNAEMLAAMGLQNRGWWGEQMADEMLSGLGKRGYAFNKEWAAPVMTKAVVRSIAPYKDPTATALTRDEENNKGANQGKDPNKGFYGGQQKFGGGYILPGGTQLKEGDQIHIKTKEKYHGNTVEFDTIPLKLSDPTGAKLASSEVATPGTWTADPNSEFKVNFDEETATTTLNLSTVAPGQPAVSTAALAASLFGSSAGLVGKTLTLVSDDGQGNQTTASLPLTVDDVLSEAAFVQKLQSTFNTLTISATNHVLTIARSTGTVTASGTAASSLNLPSAGAQSITGTASMSASLFADSAPLVGRTLTVAVDGTDTPVTFAAADVKTFDALSAKLTSMYSGLTISGSNNVVTLTHKKIGPGASIEVKSSGDAAALMGLSTTKVSGASTVAVMNAIAAAAGARATVEQSSPTKAKITFTSTTTGHSSRVNISQSNGAALAGLGLTIVAAVGTDKKALQDLTADDLVAWFNKSLEQNPALKDAVAFSSEDGQVVITCQYPGPTSFVEVTGAGPNGNNMKTALQFLGDYRGETDSDHVQELPGVNDHTTGTFVRGLDDFDKMNTELQKMPDDLAVAFRPITIIGKNAVGAVSKAVNVFKGFAKIGGIKLPTAKGSIGLIANKGISLGTQDRIVGVGGQGIIFVADGGTGLPDHAKYVPLEDTFNKIMGADLFGQVEPPKDKPTTGFRAYSDTTADLVARNTAHLLALGRSKVGKEFVGSGVARVAGSYAVEVAGQEKVVIGARHDKLGRVEVLGTTVAIGYTQVDIDDQRFGLVTRGGAVGWPADDATVNLSKSHAQTNSVLVHSAEQASILVGEYMIQVRSKKHPDGVTKSSEITQARLDAAQNRLTTAKDKYADANLAMDWLEAADSIDYEDYQNAYIEKTRCKAELTAAQDEVDVATKSHQASQEISEEGIIISMREAKAPNNASSNWAYKGKPSIVVNSKGVSITTMTGQDDDAASARIVLDNKGVTITVGGKSGVKITNNSFEFTDGTNKAKLAANAINFNVPQVTFANAQKISLG